MTRSSTFRFVLCRVRCRYTLPRHGLPVAGSLLTSAAATTGGIIAFGSGRPSAWVHPLLGHVVALSNIHPSLRQWRRSRDTTWRLAALTDHDLSEMCLGEVKFPRFAIQESDGRGGLSAPARRDGQGSPSGHSVPKRCISEQRNEGSSEFFHLSFGLAADLACVRIALCS
jgi:hypothetical protein